MKSHRYDESYRQLSAEVHDAGLVRRRYAYYAASILGWILALAAILGAVAALGDTWFQLIVAVLAGVVLTQLGFLTHEAAHRSIFASRAWNEWTSRCISGLLMGLSYSWWMAKHNTHHAHPNKEDADPDVQSTVLVLTPGASVRRTGLPAEISRFQGWFFLPLLCFEGLNLHVASLKMLFFTPKVKHRLVELLMIIARHGALAYFLWTFLPAGKALAFLCVQLVVFGVMLGGAFALNHIGMPTVPPGIHLDFLRRQVLMSRNITDGPLVRFLMGGLQYQIEHHLFPVIPRSRLPEAQLLIRQQCKQLGIKYTERTLPQAFIHVVSYLNQVGLRTQDPYACPLVQRYRG
ncbi:fatty acid desaturase family protein [Glutamicibacter sp. TV12E]|uniref:fatty acid desaturase family protein n=1 Tax=Glutamicibacter sp. TV12E TaxID=3446362 RepID=UPI0040345280